MAAGLAHGHEGCPLLVDGAVARSLCDEVRAARLTWIDVTAIPSTGSVGEVRERRPVGSVVDVHAVAQAVVRELVERWPGEEADHHPQGDVGHIVEHPSTIREAVNASAKVL